ncbi:hypothetical protein KIN20_014923 [Parelaphostrongylus tenuis]|uniref:Uncharacterized protein n=1 Tax=Parelaphostrongylus tenuis TaxID=148309 RepID=A0AAD5QLW7_PARTN|nr:hypothetical protein KIN20_014923 [Parelaphostrongylus tenuis]
MDTLCIDRLRPRCRRGYLRKSAANSQVGFLKQIVTEDESLVFYKNNTAHTYSLRRGEDPPERPLSIFGKLYACLVLWKLADHAANENCFTTSKQSMVMFNGVDPFCKIAAVVREKRSQNGSLPLNLSR